MIEHMMRAARDANRPALAEGSPDQARRIIGDGRDALGAGPEVSNVANIEIPTRSGFVNGRVYRPKASACGLLVYLHGGGWVCGSLDDYDVVARSLAVNRDCAVLMVDYRLAHCGTKNPSQVPRPILYLVYARKWFTDAENFVSRARFRPPG